MNFDRSGLLYIGAKKGFLRESLFPFPLNLGVYLRHVTLTIFDNSFTSGLSRWTSPQTRKNLRRTAQLERLPSRPCVCSY